MKCKTCGVHTQHAHMYVHRENAYADKKKKASEAIELPNYVTGQTLLVNLGSVVRPLSRRYFVVRATVSARSTFRHPSSTIRIYQQSMYDSAKQRRVISSGALSREASSFSLLKVARLFSFGYARYKRVPQF